MKCGRIMKKKAEILKIVEVESFDKNQFSKRKSSVQKFFGNTKPTMFRFILKLRNIISINNLNQNPKSSTLSTPHHLSFLHPLSVTYYIIAFCLPSDSIYLIQRDLSYIIYHAL